MCTRVLRSSLPSPKSTVSRNLGTWCRDRLADRLQVSFRRPSPLQLPTTTSGLTQSISPSPRTFNGTSTLNLLAPLSRGGQGSYLARLPPGYEEGNERYPVLIWLHGGMQTQRDAIWALQYYGRKMEEGKMPKTIIVAPQVGGSHTPCCPHCSSR
jgi:hypothetical protein